MGSAAKEHRQDVVDPSDENIRDIVVKDDLEGTSNGQTDRSNENVVDIKNLNDVNINGTQESTKESSEKAIDKADITDNESIINAENNDNSGQVINGQLHVLVELKGIINKDEVNKIAKTSELSNESNHDMVSELTRHTRQTRLTRLTRLNRPTALTEETEQACQLTDLTNVTGNTKQDEQEELSDDNMLSEQTEPNNDNISGLTPRRVKVYLLQGEDWLDNGTGYCVGEVDTSSNLPYFVVRNELNSDEVILKSFLEGSIQYQRQQETLIVWTDLTGKDLALLFQESEGCNDLCEFIIRVQQEHLSPDISLYYVIPNMSDDIGGISSTDISSNTNDITELITGPISYPPDPTQQNLEEILELCNQNSNSKFTRLSLRNFIIRDNYVLKLIKVFKVLEEAQNLSSLYVLSDIIKTMILFNETPLIEHILRSDELMWGVVGILEYDSSYPIRALFREAYKDNSFKLIIDVKGNIEIFKKDFHLNFLKDVVMARFLDDQCFSMFSSLIYVNQVDIIEFLKDEDILRRLFKFYEEFEGEEEKEQNGTKSTSTIVIEDPSKEDTFSKGQLNAVPTGASNGVANGASKGIAHGISNGISGALTNGSNSAKVDHVSLQSKRNGVKMLHQYMVIAKNLQSFQKLEFFANLVKNGLFTMLRFALRDEITRIRVLGTELIVIIIEQDVSLVNSIDNEDSIDNSEPPVMAEIILTPDDDDTFVESKNLKLKLSDDMTLITILTNLLLEDKNPGLKIQAFEALRMLLDSNIASTTSALATPSTSEPESGSCDDFNDINTKNYFKAFYSKVAPKLFNNLVRLATESSPEVISQVRGDALLYQQLCDLISYCTKEHDVNISRPFFLDQNILLGVVKLLELNVKLILKLSALRCLKNIVLLNDNFYCRYIVKSDILDYFFAFFETHKNENNLMNSTCLDFVEVLLKNCDPSVCSKRQNFKLLVSHIYSKYQKFVEESLNYVTTGNDLILLVENGFYENVHHADSSDDGAIIDDSDDLGIQEEKDDIELDVSDKEIGDKDIADKGDDKDIDVDIDSDSSKDIILKSPASLFDNIDQELIKKRQLEAEDQAAIVNGSATKKLASGNKKNGTQNQAGA